ncbi:MAG: hypothetical protein AABZ55_04855 [Bdellovibrionota bacterium]
MPNGWDIYYVVFLSALLALGFPVVLGTISFLFADPKVSRSRKEGRVELEKAALGQRINTRFFLGVNATIILITLVLALIPISGMILGEKDKGTVFRGLLLVISIGLAAALGLLYSARKGDLSWVGFYQKFKDRGLR